jgi:hypothetical protein
MEASLSIRPPDRDRPAANHTEKILVTDESCGAVDADHVPPSTDEPLHHVTGEGWEFIEVRQYQGVLEQSESPCPGPTTQSCDVAALHHRSGGAASQHAAAV